jgi:hypothetical protein
MTGLSGQGSDVWVSSIPAQSHSLNLQGSTNKPKEILILLGGLNHDQTVIKLFSMNYGYPGLDPLHSSLPCMWVCMEALQPAPNTAAL